MKQKQKLSAWLSFAGFLTSSRLPESFNNSRLRLVGLIQGKKLLCGSLIERGTATFLRTAHHAAGYAQDMITAVCRIYMAFERQGPCSPYI